MTRIYHLMPRNLVGGVLYHGIVRLDQAEIISV